MVTCKRRGWGRLLGWCITGLLITYASSAVALDLRVQGRSELDVDVTSAGTRILVDGALRDDLEQPLPHRSLQVEVRDEVTRNRVKSQTVETNQRGEFSVTLEVPPGEYLVRSTFEETAHVMGSESERSLRVRPEPVQLYVNAPKLVRGTGKAVDIHIRATIGATSVALPVEVRVDDGEVERHQLNEKGRTSVDVSGRLKPGRNPVRVSVPRGSYREPASEVVHIFRAETFQLDADVESVFRRFERGASVSGRVFAHDRAVQKADIEATLVHSEAQTLSVSDAGEAVGAEPAKRRQNVRLEKTTKTDADGRFRILFNRNQLTDGRWVASVKVIPDRGPAFEREVGTVEIDRTLSRFIVNGAAGIALFAVALVVLREMWRAIRKRIERWRRQSVASEKRRRAFEEEATLEAVPVAENTEIPSGSGAKDTVRGQVWNVWRDEPVPEAQVTLRDGTTEATLDRMSTSVNGYFVFEDLGAGALELVIEADYFVRGRFSFELPHSGALNPCRFELIPVPLKIRRLYQSLVELAHGEDLWGEIPPSEIRETVSEVLETVPSDASGGAMSFVREMRALAEGRVEGLETTRDYLEALTGLVEETYFGPRNYGEATWRVAREIALELRNKLENDESS